MEVRSLLFEWEDQPWLPRVLRDFITDHLRDNFSAPAAEPLRRTVSAILLPPLRRSGSHRIVDVCSGGGGPLPALLPLLREGLGAPLTATLTDLFPNQNAFTAAELASGGTVRGERNPVSAFDVPEALGSFETMFTAFHHFDRVSAGRVLADAAAKHRTIVVIEPFRFRDAPIVALGGFLRGVLLTPRVGRLDWRRFLWTYPLPLSAFVLAWDGAVSCLRAYEPHEMLEIARAAVPHGYRWEAKRAPIEGSPIGLTITSLVGEPERAST